MISRIRNKNTNTPVYKDELGIDTELSIDDQDKQAGIKKKDAETGDIKAQTWLKVGLSIFIAIIMSAILFFQFYIACRYLTHIIEMEKEIPKEVVISIFAASAAVTTLMGFILKGLFNSK